MASYMDITIYLMILLFSLKKVMSESDLPRKKLQPKFLPTPTNITVHRGELAVLRCHIVDLGPKVVVWRKESNDVPITIGPTTFSQEEHMAIEVQKISEEESKWDLIIKDVQPKHAGTYLCQVTASKLYTHYVTLQVLAEPKKVEDSLQLAGTEYVNQDDTINLRCNATGTLRPPSELEWFFNGQRMISSANQWRGRTAIVSRTVGRTFISDLIIERSRPEDGGIYICRSSDLKVNSISVNVLSAEKPNVSRREQNTQKPRHKGSDSSSNLSPDSSSNLSQADDSPSSSAPGTVHHHFNIHNITALAICLLLVYTSNCIIIDTTNILHINSCTMKRNKTMFKLKR